MSHRPHRNGAPALMLLALAAVGCGGSSGGGVFTPPPGDVSVGDVQSQVFTPNCTLSGCHAGPQSPFGLDLTAGASHGNLVGVQSAELSQYERVTPGNVVNSYLYMKITGDSRILGDPMPVYGFPLRQADIDLVREWIEQGAR